jgi:hypothetical protein
MKNNRARKNVVLSIFTSGLVMLVLAASALAHNVKGIEYPTLATARITSPNATQADFPIPIYNTGVSVACFNVRNTSPHNAVISAVGLELPGDNGDFTLVLPTDSNFQLGSQVDLIPFYQERLLDFAFLTGPRFNSDGGRRGLSPSSQFTTFCAAGRYPAGLSIETMLNFVFVRFTRVGPDGNLSDIGIWENAPIP